MTDTELLPCPRCCRAPTWGYLSFPNGHGGIIRHNAIRCLRCHYWFYIDGEKDSTAEIWNNRPTQGHDALEEMQAHCWHYADALTRITRLVPVKLESGGGRAEFEQAKFIAKTALTNLPTPQAGKLAEDWERLTGCAAAMGYSSLEDMVEKIASLYVTGRLPTPQAEAAPLVQWGTQRLNPKWAEAAPDDGLVAETVKRALISYLFEACQPDRGDVFSWMDDHADDVVVTILTALRARPSGDGEVLPKAGDA